VRRILLGRIRSAVLRDRIDLVEPLEDARAQSPNGFVGRVPV
jgi:hypothetical protein